MISGVQAVDWNNDGNLGLVTGQGHGGSGVRFFGREYVEDLLRSTLPQVAVTGRERSSGQSSP
jgi:hypothetical protein